MADPLAVEFGVVTAWSTAGIAAADGWRLKRLRGRRLSRKAHAMHCSTSASHSTVSGWTASAGSKANWSVVEVVGVTSVDQPAGRLHPYHAMRAAGQSHRTASAALCRGLAGVSSGSVGLFHYPTRGVNVCRPAHGMQRVSTHSWSRTVPVIGPVTSRCLAIV